MLRWIGRAKKLQCINAITITITVNLTVIVAITITVTSAHLCMSEYSSAAAVDFAELTAETMWNIFEAKAYNGGVLAYAVLSRANKLGCSCSAALEKTKEGRKRQLESWIAWSSKFCNLFWAKRVAFDVVSTRSSFKNHLTAVWHSSASSALVPTLYTSCSEIKLPDNILARVASLVLYSDGADWLSQVECCASDARRCVIPTLWSKVKAEFVCNTLWMPSYKFSFSDEVASIDPSACCQTDVLWNVLAENWNRILLRMSTLLSLPVKDAHFFWNDHVCNPALIPISERVIVMWIWLLWSSHELPTFLNQKICSQALVDQRGVEERLMFLQNLRSKRIITRDEFSRKRSCILNCL